MPHDVAPAGDPREWKLNDPGEHSGTLKGIDIKAVGDSVEVLIYDRIGSDFLSEGVTAKAFAEKLSNFGKGIKSINVRINSPGGSVFEGTAIYNTLRNHAAKVTVDIDGAALSIASLIAMAGDEIRIADNGFVMIHDPTSYVRGTAATMRKHAETLELVKSSLVDAYAKRTNQSVDEIARMMTAETWMDAKDALRLGFATSVKEKVAIAASFDIADFGHPPDRFRQLLAEGKAPASIPQPKEPRMATETTPALATVAVAELKPQEAGYQDLVAGCIGADSDFICKQLGVKATLPQAQQAWMQAQADRLKASQTELAAAKDAAKAAAAKPGVAPVATGATSVAGESGGDAIAKWNEAVEAHVKAGLPKGRAISAAAKADPDLHRAYVVAINEAAGRKRAAASFAAA